MENPPHLSVTYSTIAPAALASIVEADYHLEAPIQCTFWHRGFNDHYVVTAGSTKYMLRVYSSGKYWIGDQRDFQFELDLLSYLYRSNVSVSYPIRRRDGEMLGTLRAPEGIRYFALFSYAAGKPLASFDPEQIHILGQNVAKLHLAANQFVTHRSRYHLDLNILIDKPMELIERYIGDERKHDLTFLAPLTEQLKKHLLGLSITGDGYGIIHADIHEGNVHFTADDDIVFFDFDHCGYGWRAYDIAVCLTGEPTENQAAFLQGYQLARQLQGPELEAIPTFRKVRDIWDTGDNLARANTHGARWINDRHWDRLIVRLSE